MADQVPTNNKHTSEKAKDMLVAQAAQWTGPLPPPAALEHFDRIIPGSADRILKMAEQEQAHRIQCDSTTTIADIGDFKRGQWLGGVVAFGAIAGSVATSLYGAPWQVSVALVGVPLLSAVNALVQAKRKR